MKSLFSLLSSFLLALLTASVFAQTTSTSQSNPANPPELSIIIGARQIKFTPLRNYQELRLEVFNSVSELLYDSGAVKEAELNWNLRDSNDQPLAPGLYAYTLSLKVPEAEAPRRHQGHFIIEKGNDQIWLTTKGEGAIGAAVTGGALDIARSPTGATAGTGYLASGRTLSERAGIQRDAQGRTITDKNNGVTREGGPTLNISGSGTTGRLTKWQDGPNGVVADSVLHETAAGDLGIGTTAPGGVLDVVRNSPNPLIGRFWNTGTGPAQLRFVGGTGSTSQFLITDTAEWLTSIAVSNSIGMQLRVRGVGTPNNEAELTNSARLTMLRNGNVGVGTTAPAEKLHVAGNGLFTGALDVQGQSSKIRFHFDTQAQLPSAATYHGMLAHVHADAKVYYAHGGVWVPLANEAHTHAAGDITSGVMSIANGGTGSATQNFVDLTAAQMIAGIKTFSSTIVGNITGNAATVTNGFYTTSTLGGDVTGTPGATKVEKLQNLAVPVPAAADDGKVLKYQHTGAGAPKFELVADANSGGTVTSITAGAGLSGGTITNSGAIAIANNGVDNAQLANNAVTAAKIASGNVVKTLNSLTDAVTLAAGANVAITPAGNTLTIAAPNALTAVTTNATLTGNGTSGNPLSVAAPLALSASSASPIISATNTNSGDALAGTSANGYAGKFTGRTQTSYATTGVTANNQKTTEAATTATFDTTAGALTNYSGYFSNAATRSAGANNLTNVGVYATASGAQNNYAALFDAGNVGIGTTAPTSKLHVVGDTNLAGNLTFSGALNGSGANLSSLNASNITSGILAAANGGTGLNAAGAAGNYLRSNGTTWTSSAIQAADVPSGSTFYIQNQNAGAQAAANFHISGNGTAGGTLSGNIVNVTTQYNIGGSRILSNSGTNNLFLGIGAGTANTTGRDQVFVGHLAGEANTSGAYNTFVGKDAGKVNTTGGFNVFVGTRAAEANISGAFNTFIGYEVGQVNSSGTVNTFVGEHAGIANNTGTSNTFIGGEAAFSNTSGGNNTALGYRSAVGATNFNATAIGFRASATCSNCMVLGSINGVNGSTVDTSVGIGTVTPTERLEVKGNIKLNSGNTVKFADGTNIGGAITANELANNAVTTAKILDANVTTAKLADGAVTAAKLAVPLSLSSAVAGSGIVTATNSDTTGRGLSGIASAATGVNAGVYGEAASPNGYGVHGKNTGANGVAGFFEGNVSLTGNINSAWRTQANAISPNIIGGSQTNTITAGVAGGVISGGGESGNLNTVTDDYGTVGGGRNNRAGNNTGTLADAEYATVSGGINNSASGVYATIAGGSGNAASQNAATIGGGAANTASGSTSTIAGGASNTANAQSATIAGGSTNTASGAFTSIGGGQTNTASGYGVAIAGGDFNTASGSRSAIPGGSRANASHFGELAFASGSFTSAAGTAQMSNYVLRTLTANASTTELTLNGSFDRLTIADGRSVTFDILVVARQVTTGASASYRFKGGIKRVGATTSLVGAVVKEVLGEDDGSWDVNVSADDTNDALKIEVTGIADQIRWVATVRTVEVQW